MDISAGKLWGLRRLADDAGRFKMTAIDQRPPIMNVVKERRGTSEATYADVVAVKRALAEALAPHSSAVLLDPNYAYAEVIGRISPRRGVIHTLEHHVFDETSDGRRSREVPDWTVAKIKRAGGDAVKVLVWYRPDAAPAVCHHQQDLVRWVGEACKRYDLPFVLEMLLYPLASDAERSRAQARQPGRRPELVVETVRTFAEPQYGVDLFKLESPVPAAEVPDPANPVDPEVQTTQRWYDQMGELAGRPWVMLSAGAGKDPFKRVLTYAYRAGASGFLAGRAIWWQAFQRFPDLDAMAAELQSDGVPYMREISALTDAHARPWHAHPAYGEGPRLADAGEGWHQRYPEFESLA